MFGKRPQLAVATKAEVGTSALDLDLTDQHASTIPNIDAVAASGVDVSKNITLDPIRHSCVGVGEDAAVR